MAGIALVNAPGVGSLASQKLVSRAALDIAKEQVSADYQKHAAAKKFAAEKEVMNYEKKQMEGQVAALRLRASEIALNLKKSENIARVMTDRCRTLEHARMNEEALRQQAEIRESNLFNLLVAEETRCRELKEANEEKSREISSNTRSAKYLEKLEDAITELTAKLLKAEQRSGEVEGSSQTDILEKKIMELSVENQCLRDDVSRLQRRQQETIDNTDPSSASGPIIADFLQRQTLILKEKEAIEAEARALSTSNSALKERLAGMEAQQSELNRQIQLLQIQHGLTVTLTSLSSDVGKHLTSLRPSTADASENSRGTQEATTQLRLTQAKLQALQAHCISIEAQLSKSEATVTAMQSKLDAAVANSEKASMATAEVSAALAKQCELEAVLRSAIESKEARIQALTSDCRSATAEVTSLRAQLERMTVDHSLLEDAEKRSARQTLEVEKLTTEKNLLTLQYEACATELNETRTRCDLLSSLASKHGAGLAARTFDLEQAKAAIRELESRCAEVPALIRQAARVTAGREEAIRDGVEAELARRDPALRESRSVLDSTLALQLTAQAEAAYRERHVAACAAVACRRAASSALEQVGSEVQDIAEEMANQITTLSSALRIPRLPSDAGGSLGGGSGSSTGRSGPSRTGLELARSGAGWSSKRSVTWAQEEASVSSLPPDPNRGKRSGSPEMMRV